jgi:hypothetical protein
MALNYKQKYNGKKINKAVKTKLKTYTGKKATKAGKVLWETVLNIIYQDLNTTLADKLHLYLKSAKVVFPPGVEVNLPANKPKLKFNYKTAAKTINQTITTQCKNMTGEASQQTGKIVWQNLCQQIGNDLLKIIPDAVVNSCNNVITQVPAGFMAPPMIKSLSPAPPIYTGLQKDLLKTLLEPYFKVKFIKLGPKIDKEIKKKTSKLNTKKMEKYAGQYVWDTVIKNIIPAIDKELNSKIQLFFAQSTGVWQTTPVPGRPIVSGSPTPGVSPSPANIII